MSCRNKKMMKLRNFINSFFNDKVEHELEKMKLVCSRLYSFFLSEFVKS